MFFSSSDSHSNEEAVQIGQLLKQSREAHSGTIEEAADQLRLDPALLAALEAGRIGDLPGWARSISALRAYAEYLELDASPLVVRFRKLMAEPAPGYTASMERSAPPPRPQPQPQPKPQMIAAPAAPEAPVPQAHHHAPEKRHKMPTGLVFAVTLFIGVAVIAGWYLASGPAEDQNVQPISSKLKDMLDRTIGLAAQDDANKANNSDSLTTETKPLPGLTPAEEAAPRTTVKAKTSPLPANIPEGGNTEVAGNVVSVTPLDRLTVSREAATERLTLRAKEQVWVRIADAAGQSIKTWEMKPGEMYLIPDQKDLILEARNAGAIELFRDGKLIGLLGKAGDTITGLKLDSAIQMITGG